jgi:DNA-3-methyladenine glycosylase II
MPAYLDRVVLPPPYDFATTAAAAHYYTTLGVYRDGRFRRALHAGDGLALVEFASAGSPEAPAVDIVLLAQQGNADLTDLRARAAALLNPHLELQPFYALAQSDARLWPVVTALHGLGLLATETLFEAIAVTLIEQQIALSAAQRAERWLVAWADEGIDYQGERYRAFPRAERLAAASVEELTPLKITFRRMSTLIQLAQMEVEDSFERLRGLETPTAYAALMALNGIGHWTAAWVLTRGLGRVLYCGSADVALRAAVNAYFYSQPGRSDAATTDGFFAAYGEYAGIAAFYTLMRWAFDRYPGGTRPL